MMGLLDSINEVLLQTPRKYWGEKANRLGSLLSDSAESGANAYAGASGPLSPQHAQTLGGLLADFTPIVGDVKSAYDGVQSAREGDYLGAALGGLGALPMVPNLGGMIKPNFSKWGLNAPDAEDLGGAMKYVFKTPEGKQTAHIVLKETPEDVVIDGLHRVKDYNNRLAGKGDATKAVKAVIEEAINSGKNVRATAAGYAKPYWSGVMGFERDMKTDLVSPDYLMTKDQLRKIQNGDITTTAWPHPKGYGDMFLDMYGPMIK